MTQGERNVMATAIATVNENSPQSTDDKWLERLTVATGPHIREWDITQCYHWSNWPERETHFPGTTNQDIGIDAVAVRSGDCQHVAIQCKSRQLDAEGQGADINTGEIDKFANVSVHPFWADERDSPTQPICSSSPLKCTSPWL